MHTDMHGIGKDTETAENVSKNVRTCQIESKKQNSPNVLKLRRSSVPRSVSADDIEVYVPYNMSLKALWIADRTFAFG